MSKRFFAFGCSYTEYHWPTWADIIANTLNADGWECYNYGNSGSGNYGMLASMFAADKKHCFTEDDVLMVMWSSWNREDRYIVNYNWDRELRGQWTKEGNVLTAGDMAVGVYNQDFVKRYWSLENDIVTNTLAIESARKMFNFAYEGSLPVYEDPNSNEDDIPEYADNATMIFNKFLSATTNDNNAWSKLSIDFLEKTQALGLLKHSDGHPFPSEHLKYVTDVIQPTLPHIKLTNQQTTNWANNFDMILHKHAEHARIAGEEIRGDWLGNVHKRHRDQQKQYLAGTRFDLWQDSIFLRLLDQIQSEKYKT